MATSGYTFPLDSVISASPLAFRLNMIVESGKASWRFHAYRPTRVLRGYEFAIATTRDKLPSVVETEPDECEVNGQRNSF